jgi:Protein of unknown function (DUF2808)
MSRFFKIALATLLITTSLSIVSATAVTLRDGITYFEKPPRLTSSTTTRNGSYIWGASYYFTVEIPKKSGEPLAKLVIEQQGGSGKPEFNVKDTEVFEGTQKKRGDRLTFKSIDIQDNPVSITAIFDPPIPPGKTITLRLYPVRNPQIGGIYLYGVTAFPAGEKPHGQFLGFGRIRILDRSRD